jgi:beta-N-acetylhexosaminidase
MLMLGVGGTELDATEREWLAHSAVSGVILFGRNIESRAQVQELVAEIRAACPRPLLLAIDQEGGPVQRLREGYTRLPALARIGEHFAGDPGGAIAMAERHAWVMAAEMRATDIDLSFAPVIDLARGNRAIGERAFHADPEFVSALGLAYLRGMRLAGMAATIKHFPGHGSVVEDTHFDHAVDTRSRDAIERDDLVPFRDAIQSGAEAVMMAHVSYPAVDPDPAGYSRRWIGEILRGELGFGGVVMSDDIGMVAAESVGGVAERIDRHLDAGCDLVLVCQPALAPAALAACAGRGSAREDIVARLAGLAAPSWGDLHANPQYLHFAAALDPAALRTETTA